MKSICLFLLTLACALAMSLNAQTVPDRKGAVLQDRETLKGLDRWIYNDFGKGFEVAKETGKPLLVVLRCVPCLACSGIDSQVLMNNDSLDPLLDQFVCVRVINANALDLSKFQFDYDLSFSTLFFNGDGTLYGRYGSWTHQENPADKTVAGYRRALEAALALHENYPANKNVLVGKQGKPVPYKTPLEIPGLSGRYQPDLDWNDKVVQSCVHCHQIGDAIRSFHRDQGGLIPEKWVYSFPEPETIGLELAHDQVARVVAVKADSPAYKAGIRPGDDLTALDQQPLISIADVSWALHQKDGGTLVVEFRRDHQAHAVRLELPTNWRYRADLSNRVGTWPMRAMALGGLLLKELEESRRKELGLAHDELGLVVQHVGQYGRHAVAMKAGVLKGDVLVAVKGNTQRLTEGQLIGDLLRNHLPGDIVRMTILREGERMNFDIKMQ